MSQAATDPPGKSHISKWKDVGSGTIKNPVHLCLSGFPQFYGLSAVHVPQNKCYAVQ